MKTWTLILRRSSQREIKVRAETLEDAIDDAKDRIGDMALSDAHQTWTGFQAVNPDMDAD